MLNSFNFLPSYLYIYIYKVVIQACVCLFGCPIITQEPFDRLAKHFDWVNRSIETRECSLPEQVDFFGKTLAKAGSQDRTYSYIYIIARYGHSLVSGGFFLHFLKIWGISNLVVNVEFPGENEIISEVKIILYIL